MATEKEIQNDILRCFATTDSIRLWRINVGTYLTQDGRRMVRSAPVGHPDLCGFLMHGRALYIEVKRPGKKLTVEQYAFARTAGRFGALHIVASSVEDVERALRMEGYAVEQEAKR